MHYSRPQNQLRKTANAIALARSSRFTGTSKRFRGSDRMDQSDFSPPEDWYEPSSEATDGYKIIAQPPGEGYRHVVTPTEIRKRLSELPASMTDPIERIQLSRMTRKKQTFPCYGMQWGTTLYLYPIEESLVEEFTCPPKPSVINEARQFGGRWRQDGACWTLEWTLTALKDFYLNNILIHELGHLLDSRNTSYLDRERYAEWFALEYGYKPTLHRRRTAKSKRKVTRRHHSK
ncbi:MAG: hypothetical protein AAF497_11345 [Planctomycetota bacterium]